MSATSSTITEKQVVLRAAFAEVLRNPGNGQQQLSALRSFEAGEVICPFHAGETVATPTYLTVQTGVDTHITLRPEFLQYINHSCNPNVFFDTSSYQLVSLKPIAEGEEFTFFYPSTEWSMIQPFVCQCGSANCLQLIQGASFLSIETLQQYRLTDFIQQQLYRKAQPESV